MKTATITGKGQISIPGSMRKEKGFRTGEKVVIISYKNRIEIRPASNFIKALKEAAVNEKALSKHWNTKEDEEAWKNL